MEKLITLDSSSYEHSFDHAAMAALRCIPVFEQVSNFVLNWTYIKWQVVQLSGSNFHVTPKSCPELYNLVHNAAETLNLDRMPSIYTQWSYCVNAYTTGYKDDSILVIFSGAVDLMNDTELTYIVGHELGHIKSGHVLYHIMGAYLSQIIAAMGVAVKPFLVPLQLSLRYWDRMSEFTADRAGLLACQDLNASLSAIMKMAGIPKRYFNTADPHVFAEQAQEFLTQYGDTAHEIIKKVSILDDTHPWTIMRAAELIKWVESGEYQNVINAAKGKTCVNPLCKSIIPQDATRCPICGFNQ